MVAWLLRSLLKMRLNATRLGSIASSRSFGDQLYDLAGEVPPLDLNFAGTKTLDPRVSFTRASSGTFVGSDGLIQAAAVDAPRFDHDPTTGESLGLLVEEARTNLIQQSEDFGDAVWSSSAASISTNTTAAPDGTTSGDTFTSSGTTIVSQPIAKTASAITYSSSLFVKGTVTAFTFSIDDGTATNRGRVVFNLSTGTISSTNNDGAFTGTSGTITSFSNNWYRLTVATTTNSTVVARMRLFWTGAGTSLDFWGAQLEAGSFPTSYIPTVAATVTRAADVASITGANFSSWYNQTEGTVFANANVLSTSKTNQVISFNNGTLNNRVELRLVGGADTMRTDCVVSGVTKYSNQSFALTGQRRIGALAIKANDFRMQAGASGISPASDAVPTVDRLYLNYATFAGSEINGTIRRLTYWPTRLGNEVLQRITQ
jgi:hypothetical protein